MSAPFTPEAWARVKAALAEALERAGAERDRFLEELRAADPELAAEVGSLIASYERAGAALEPLADERELPAGSSLGPYRIEGVLGAGGMGRIYGARHERLGRAVALKVLHPASERDPQARARLEREARTIAALSHPNIVALFDFGEQDGLLYAAMEALGGETLRARLARGGLPFREVARIGAEIASGLEAAHAAGVVHRDVKPENLFLTEDGGVKILDFGLARWAEPVQGSPGGPSLTGKDVFIGTPSYMAPEQLRARKADSRADLFALGCVLYEAVAGESPFGRENPGDTVVAVLEEEPRPLRERGFAVPAAFDELVLACLAKQPERRTLAAGEIAARLSSLARGERPRAWAGLLGRRPRVTLSWGAALLLAALLLAQAARQLGAAPSLAAAPFEASAKELGYAAEGLREGLLNRVARGAGARVVPRARTEPAAAAASDPLEFGRRAGAGLVLAGRLTSRDGELVGQFELIDVARGAQAWGKSYTRPAGDVLGLEEDVFRDLASRLRLDTASETQAELRRRYPANREAYRLYLEGRFHWDKRTPSSLQRAVGLFEQALALDPGFARAWAGVADAHSALTTYDDGVDPGPAEARARAAALRAVELDPGLAAGRAALARVLIARDFDWKRAEQEFRLAIATDPDDAEAHKGLGLQLLVSLGRLDEARAHAERALELEPLSLPTAEALGRVYYYARDYRRAEAEWRKILAMDGRFVPARWRLGQTLLAAGRADEALAVFAEADQQAPGSQKGRALIAYALARAGRANEARRLLRELLAEGERRYLPAPLLGLVHAGLGEPDAAFPWLERGCRERAQWMHLIKVEPLLDPLRGDPRFPALLACVGLGPG